MAKERQCSGCTKQDEWGCRAVRWREPEKGKPDHPSNWIRPAKVAINVDGEYTYACPRQPLMEEPEFWSSLLKYYGMFKRGFLPDEGAVSAQSNRAITLFDILDAANNDCDDALREQEARRKNRQIPAAHAAGAKGRR